MGDLKVFPGNNDVNKLKEAVRFFKESMSAQIEWYQLLAELHKAKYDSLISKGFTPQQALELCKTLF